MRRAIFLLPLAACTGGDPVVFEEHFECDEPDALCGWKAGPAAEVVATIHPGEHALHLPEPDRATRELPPIVLDGCATVELVTDCHWGPPPGGGDWRGADAIVEGDALVIRLPAQTYELYMVPQRAAVPLAGEVEVRSIAVDNPSWDCRVDAIAIVPAGGC